MWRKLLKARMPRILFPKSMTNNYPVWLMKWSAFPRYFTGCATEVRKTNEVVGETRRRSLSHHPVMASQPLLIRWTNSRGCFVWIRGIGFKDDVRSLEAVRGQRTFSLVQVAWCHLEATLHSPLEFKDLDRWVSPSLTICVRFRGVAGLSHCAV